MRIPVSKAEKVISDIILKDKSLRMLNNCEFRLADLYLEVNDLKTRLEKCVNSEKRVLELVAEGLTSMEISKETLKREKDNIELLQELMMFQDITDDEYREKLKEIINLIIIYFV